MNVYDEEKLQDMAELLLKNPQTIEQLTVRYNRSTRTIKRWIAEIRARGLRIVRDGAELNSPYFAILEQ